MSTETGTIVKCVKGNHWWLLVFTTPLLIYSALIYPIKNCKDKRKDHLRGLSWQKKIRYEALQVKRIEQHDTVAAVDDSINTTVIEREQGENTNKRHGSIDDKVTTLHQNHNPSPIPNSKGVTPKHDELMIPKTRKKRSINGK